MFTSCGSSGINSACDHILNYDPNTGKLSLDIGGCVTIANLGPPTGGAPLTCASLSALMTPGPALTPTTKLFGEGCKTYTVNQLVTAIAAAGGDKQLLSIVGPKLLISNGNDVLLSDIVAGALGQTPMPAALSTALNNALTTLLTNSTSAVTTEVKQLIAATVTCPFIKALFPAAASGTTIAPTTTFLASDCNSYTLSDIAGNLKISPANINPGTLPPGVTVPPSNISAGALPANVTVPASSITATAGLPAATDELLTASGKKLKIVQAKSVTGIALNYWVLAAA